MPGGQVIARRQPGPPGGLGVSLGRHEEGALVPELEPRRRVDGVVDAAVAGVEAAQQGGVGGIDDGIGPQTGDVSLPQRHAGAPGDLRQGHDVHRASLRRLGGQEPVLEPEKLRAQGQRRTDVHQSPQEPPRPFPGPELRRPEAALGHLGQQHFVELLDLPQTVHGETSSLKAARQGKKKPAVMSK